MGFLSSSIAKLLPFSSCYRVQDGNRRGKPALVLKNESSYVVSFWVLQEDKLKTMSTVTEAGTGIGGTLEIAADSRPLATANMAKTTRSITVRQKDTFYLLRDHRVGAEGTTVLFPKDCRDLRVVGYVNRKSGKRKDKRVLGHFKKYFSRKKWKLFKDEVYSIDRGDKTFTVVAKDEDIDRYI